MNDDELLVGGLKHEFYFPFHIWDVILPIDFHIFQRGRYTTNQLQFTSASEFLLARFDVAFGDFMISCRLIDR